MANIPKKQHPIEKLADDIEFRQRNTTWPDVMVNAGSADELMWKGSRHITKVQRVGVGVFGAFFVLGGVSTAASLHGEGWWIGIPIEMGFFLVGCKLLWNSIRKNQSPKEKQKNE